VKDLHTEFLFAAYAVFAVALLWDFFTPRIAYKKVLRRIVLKSMRAKSKP
jgi:hypothetical protein